MGGDDAPLTLDPLDSPSRLSLPAPKQGKQRHPWGWKGGQDPHRQLSGSPRVLPGAEAPENGPPHLEPGVYSRGGIAAPP